MKFLRTTWWGSNSDLLLNIYKSLIRSKIEYGAFIWNNLPQYMWNKIKAIQNQTIRLFLSYRKSTPINVMLIEAYEPLLEDRFKFLGMNYIFRINAHSNYLLPPILDKMRNIVDNPTIVTKFPSPFFLKCYMESTQFDHLIFFSEIPIFCLYSLNLSFFTPNISFQEGMQLKQGLNLTRFFVFANI